MALLYCYGILISVRRLRKRNKWLFIVLPSSSYSFTGGSGMHKGHTQNKITQISHPQSIPEAFNPENVGQRDGSFREPGFSPQHPRGSSQPTETSVPGHLTPSPGFHVHMHTQHTFTEICTYM